MTPAKTAPWAASDALIQFDFIARSVASKHFRRLSGRRRRLVDWGDLYGAALDGLHLGLSIPVRPGTNDVQRRALLWTVVRQRVSSACRALGRVGTLEDGCVHWSACTTPIARDSGEQSVADARDILAVLRSQLSGNLLNFFDLVLSGQSFAEAAAVLELKPAALIRGLRRQFRLLDSEAFDFFDPNGVHRPDTSQKASSAKSRWQCVLRLRAVEAGRRNHRRVQRSRPPQHLIRGAA